MQRIEIDCQTKRVQVIDLSGVEEAERLAESEANRQEEAVRRVRENKRLLAKHLAELREMKQQRAIFSQEDLDEKQAEIDRLLA